MKIITSEVAATKRSLAKVASVPGEQRAKFLNALTLVNVKEDDAVISLPYGKVTGATDKTGQVFKESHDVYGEDGETIIKPGTRSPDFAGVHPSLRTALPGSVPANKVVDGVIIPCGLVLIISGGGQGKTPLAHALASHGVKDYEVVRAGEPLGGYESDRRAVADQLACALINGSDIVLDSVKDVLSVGGSAMKSGISREVLVLFSTWAIAAVETGSTIYVPLNPSTNDPDVVALLIEAAKSNADMTVMASGESEWMFEARRGEGLDRRTGSLSLGFDGDSVPFIKKVNESGVIEKSMVSAISFISTTVSTESFDRSVRRSVDRLSQE